MGKPPRDHLPTGFAGTGDTALYSVWRAFTPNARDLGQKENQGRLAEQCALSTVMVPLRS